MYCIFLSAFERYTCTANLWYKVNHEPAPNLSNKEYSPRLAFPKCSLLKSKVKKLEPS